MIKIKMTLFLVLTAFCACSGKDSREHTDPVIPTPVNRSGFPTTAPEPMTWSAVAPDGTRLEGYRTERKDRFVGMFYFLWHGCHGYDRGANNNDVVAPTAADVRSPFNNEELYKANPGNPDFGGFGVMHHWGEPYLGYYVSNDRWVIRKHAQMLSEAGVDVLFMDVTNGFHYMPVVEVLCQVFTDIRKNGGRTPQIAFLLNSATAGTFKAIYNGLYARKKYQDLWFMWDGKPLVLADPEEFPAEYAGAFTLRHSWFLYNNSGADKWFGSGEDCWPWGSWYPQKPGTHGGVNECVCVMPATHPHDNLGRSYDPFLKKEPEVKTPEKGIFFKAEFEHAMELDPKMMFFTGWNEWTAQRQQPQEGVGMIGGKSTDFGCFFVDQFNHEYSRDIEPVRGGFGDTYYYMFADMVRKFKGTPEGKAASEKNTIVIDGDCSDWADVTASFADYVGDTEHRDHFGWGRIGQLVNKSGRNDITLCKIANDDSNIYFYAQCNGTITPCSGKNWMNLYITAGDASSNWEGFNFRVNGISPSSSGTTQVQQCNGGFKWTAKGEVKFKSSGRIIEIAVPLEMLGISNPDDFRIEFKWIDNAAGNGDIQTCLTDGDSAPDGRFRYVYSFKK